MDKNKTDYEIVYKDTINWRRDARSASQDKEREKELKAWGEITSKIDDK